MNVLESPTAGNVDPEEALLLERIRSGDEEACATLVRSYGGRMRIVARRLVLNSDDADDAVQEAFLRAFRSAHAFEGRCSLSTWLHRIVVNASLGILRRRARRPACPIDDLLPDFDTSGHHALPVPAWSEPPIVHVARVETLAQVRKCIDQLPEEYRTVLLLRDIEGMDTEATAQALETTQGAVKTRLHRARQALRTLLEPWFSIKADIASA